MSTLPPLPAAGATGDGAERADGEVIEQAPRSKQSWLGSPGDIKQETLWIEATGDEQVVKGLTAGQLARISTDCTLMKGETLHFDSARQQVMKFQAGCVEPSVTMDEANVIAEKFGPSFALVILAIDQLTKAEPEDVERAKRRFRPRR